MRGNCDYRMMNSMISKKIILTVTNDLSYDQRMARISASLAAAGYEVLLVGREKKYSIPLRQKIYGEKRLFCFFEKGKLFYLEYNIRLFFYLLAKPFDVVSAVDLDTLMPCYLASILKLKPCVYDAHEYFTEVPEVVRRPFVKRFWEALERFIVPKLNYCYTVSESIADLFEEKYRTHFHTIRNVPVLRQLNSPAQVEEVSRYIIYQGALNEGRGLEVLIEAMQHVNCELWLAGEGDLSYDLRDRVEQHRLKNRVKFLGYVEPDELFRITENAYLGVGVSENLGLSYYYSLNNKCFDYMHAGVPSISNNFPEYRKINEKYEVAVLAEATVESLVAAINFLLINKPFYEKLKQNCLRAREEFNWQKEEQKLLQLYARVG